MKTLVVGVLVVCTWFGERAVFAQAPSAAVSGTVSIAGPDGQPLVVPGVTLTLTCARAAPRTEVSGPQGEFSFADVPAAPGGCTIGRTSTGSNPRRSPSPSSPARGRR